MLVELKDLYRTPTFVIQFSVGQFEFLRKPCFRFVFVIRIRIKVLNKYLKILKSGLLIISSTSFCTKIRSGLIKQPFIKNSVAVKKTQAG